MSAPGSLNDFGRRMAAIQDGEIAKQATPSTKSRLLAGTARPARSRPRAAWVAVAATVAAVCVSLLVWRAPFGTPRALEVTLSQGERVEVGRWLGAAETPLDLHFSDGTTVVLSPGSSARVASIDPGGARVVVERGLVDVDVAHVTGARWVFDVGPFTVLVTGTNFRAGWSPETGRFTLDLFEGSVAVTGPIVGPGRVVSGGEALRVSVPEGEMALHNTPKREPSRSGDATASGSDAASASNLRPPLELSSLPSTSPTQGPPAVREPAPTQSAAVVSEPPPPSWASLAKAGKYKDAIARAESDGIDAILASATADELGLLADAARLAGKGAVAVRVLSTQRSRFKGEPQASGAAFMLGRAAFDQDKDFAAAAEWFATYLEEQPGGAFAREALGRLIEAHRLSGDGAGARAAARAYIKAYPDGPHADIARGILDN